MEAQGDRSPRRPHGAKGGRCHVSNNATLASNGGGGTRRVNNGKRKRVQRHSRHCKTNKHNTTHGTTHGTTRKQTQDAQNKNETRIMFDCSKGVKGRPSQTHIRVRRAAQRIGARSRRRRGLRRTTQREHHKPPAQHLPTLSRDCPLCSVRISRFRVEATCVFFFCLFLTLVHISTSKTETVSKIVKSVFIFYCLFPRVEIRT